GMYLYICDGDVYMAKRSACTRATRWGIADRNHCRSRGRALHGITTAATSQQKGDGKRQHGCAAYRHPVSKHVSSKKSLKASRARTVPVFLACREYFSGFLSNGVNSRG